MSGVQLIWEGGEHNFVLAINHLRALQNKCDAGPAFVLARLQTGSWFVDDVIEPIRLGLIGGGMPDAEARELVDKHIGGQPIAKFVITATVILSAAIVGTGDDEPGEADAGEA